MFFLHHAPELFRIILNASSATARILSLAVLLLSLAPLGSMYVLFFSIGLGTNNGPNSFDSSSSSYEDSLAAVLKNPNATLEEVWTALFHAQASSGFPARAVLAALQNQNDYLLLPVTAKSMQHLRILMPWILSLTLGIVVPCFLSILTLVRQRRRQQHRDWNPARDKKALKLITRCLEPYTKILRAEDRVDDPTSVAATTTNPPDEMSYQWSIPEPAMSVENRDRSRFVSGLCGICLDPFAPSNAVSWSSNPACVHCFHGACIQAWLLRTYRLKHGKHQCPCCRQSFISTTTSNSL